MDATHFDSVARFFAARLSRRQAVRQAGAGLAAGALAAAGLAHSAHAQDATSAPADAGDKTMFLFVQSFQSGSIVPKEDVEDRYTLTLEQGLGQTIYFSDRPERIVGATPTPRFLAGFGFPDDDPPNAALVVETEAGESEVAVLELFSPAYEEASRTATYEVAVLAEWERELGMGLTEAPADLATLRPSFGAAHLFIDDCPDGLVWCSTSQVSVLPIPGNHGFCWNYGGACCQPCVPGGGDFQQYWKQQCHDQYPYDLSSPGYTCGEPGQANECQVNYQMGCPDVLTCTFVHQC